MIPAGKGRFIEGRLGGKFDNRVWGGIFIVYFSFVTYCVFEMPSFLKILPKTAFLKRKLISQEQTRAREEKRAKTLTHTLH